MKTTFYVSLPDCTVLDVEVNPKNKAQECMDQVCRRLDIIEQDYFGLQYRGSRGENLWLNLRNKLDRQLIGPPPYRLQLRVKFYVQPHHLVQFSTRSLFYDQVRSELEMQKLVIESDEQMKYMVALMAQAKCGNFDQRTHQLNQYKSFLDGITEPSPQLIRDITALHRQMIGLTKESAQYKLLQEASMLQNYGVEYHEATIHTEPGVVGIGPSGAFLYFNNMELIEKLEYPMITKAEHIGKNCVLKVMNDNGIERELVLKMATQSAANAMYRCITEMHSFFCCETVHDEVSTQFSRDLKGTLASLFNEKTTLGLDYVFDIKRTSREAYDHARRVLHQPPQSSTDHSTEEAAMDCKISFDGADSDHQKCQELEDTLDHIQESFMCCVCRDCELSAALCPCGHLTCYDCANRLAECPLCRKRIDRVQRIFMPTLQTARGASSCSSVSLKSSTSSVPKHKLAHIGRHEWTLEAMDFAEQ